jgi:diadenosine tetraphosphate (Ap4A) HIT family hydrolase
MATATNCNFCNKLKDDAFLKSQFIVREFKNSYLMVGDHQTFPGYCVLFTKDHIKEIFDASETAQIEVYKELMQAAQAIQKAFQPEKMNFSNYGNITAHQHWHIFPRQKTDSNWPNPPWTLMNEFNKRTTTAEQAQMVKSKILEQL